MIIDADTNPKNQIYYIAGLILNILKQQEDKNFNYIELFEKLNEVQKVSINLYTLSLDWLYLLGTIACNEEGLLKCF